MFKILWPAGLPNRGPEPVLIRNFELRLTPGEPHELPAEWPASRVVALLSEVHQVQLVSGQEDLAKAYRAELAEAKRLEEAAKEQAAQDASKSAFLASLKEPDPPPQEAPKPASPEPQVEKPGASSLPADPKRRGGKNS